MGEVDVPRQARWGAQTQRAVENFPISGGGIGRRAGRRPGAHQGGGGRGQRPPRASSTPTWPTPSSAAAAEVAAGQWDDHFPVDVFQTGSGTSSNMNANEVIASLAAERLGRAVHPNDHVNASQSSNDVFPSAIHLAAAAGLVHDLVPALDHLAAALRDRQAEMDTGGQGRAHPPHGRHAGHPGPGAGRLRHRGRARRGAGSQAALPRLAELALGGTAVGTGINAPPGFAPAVIARLAEETGLPLTEARDHFEAQGGRDAAGRGLRRAPHGGHLAGQDRQRPAVDGERARGRACAEIRLPDLQPGSSIMPGKVNPVIPEAVIQVVAQVIGNDAAVGFAGTTGAFELNIAMPVMARNLLESVRLLAAAARLLADRSVAGLEADVERCRRYAESSPALATALAPHIGYEAAAEVVRQALAEGKTLREVVVERGLMSADEVDGGPRRRGHDQGRHHPLRVDPPRLALFPRVFPLVLHRAGGGTLG